MPKCLRLGCPNPRQNPDPYGLGLCREHNHQFRTGALPSRPVAREYPIYEAQKLLMAITKPRQTLRDVTAQTGISKDTVRRIRLGITPCVRSITWDRLQHAYAQHLYERGANSGA